MPMVVDRSGPPLLLRTKTCCATSCCGLLRRSCRLIFEFQEQFGNTPKYFEILFHVVGIDKTAYETEILIMNEITAN